MRTLVIYDSHFGNTQRVAETVAGTMNAAAIPVQAITPAMLEEAGFLVVGSPINAWNPTPAIMHFLKNMEPGRLKNKKAAAFDTRIKIFISGNAAKKIARLLQNAGAALVAPPQPFYVKDKEGPLADGELEKAQEWARQLLLISRD